MSLPTRRLAVALTLLLPCLCLGLPLLAQEAFRLPGLDLERPVHALGLHVRPGEDAASLLPAAAEPTDAGAPAGTTWNLVEVGFAELSADGQAFDEALLEKRLAAADQAPGPLVLAIRATHPRFGRWGAGGFEPPAGESPESALND